MRRDALLRWGAALVALGFAVWIAHNTYWAEQLRALPMKGEALEDAFYSVKHLTTPLGIATREITSLRSLPPQALLVVDDLRDDLLHEPVSALQNWVESGGRLVLSGNALRSSAALQNWIAVKPTGAPTRAYAAPSTARPEAPTSRADADCPAMIERINGVPARTPLRACMPSAIGLLAYDGDRSPRWSLSDDAGIHVVRTAIGLGEVTVFGAPTWIWSNRMLPRGDDALIFVFGAGLRHGDTLLILAHSRAEPLIALFWHLAAPAILFLLAAILLLIWRNLPRFGPPLPIAPNLRRSLAEQLRANARFAVASRNLGFLLAAAKRGLEEAAHRQIAGYSRFDPSARALSLAERTGIDGGAIAAALQEGILGEGGLRTSNEHRAAITLMELCRRQLDHPRIRPRA